MKGESHGAQDLEKRVAKTTDNAAYIHGNAYKVVQWKKRPYLRIELTVELMRIIGNLIKLY